MKRFAWILVAMALLSFPALAEVAAPVAAQADPDAAYVPGEGAGNRYVRLSGRMQNLLVWRNDSDFDRTAPFYNAAGQDVGVLGTFLAPKLVVSPAANLRLVVELEIGLNVWSANDPDAYVATSASWFRMAFRQAYTEGSFLSDRVGFRVGYEQLFDPTGLFVGHWLGAASVWGRFGDTRVTATVAQLPDQTFEGLTTDGNNFNSDSILYGVRVDQPLGAAKLSAAVIGLHDTQVVRQPLDLVTVAANLEAKCPKHRMTAGLDAALQYGVAQGRASGSDETTVAWAVQAYYDLVHPLAALGLDLLFHANTMALSADDDFDGNARNGAFLYSGKSRSRTMILTEDEVRDRGGNLDERISDRRHGDSGKFFAPRPGYSVTDVSLGLDVAQVFRPVLTLGAAWALKSDNALGARFVGFETDLDLQLRLGKLLTFDVIGSFLLPGRAAAAFVNRTGDRTATDPIGQIETSLTLNF